MRTLSRNKLHTQQQRVDTAHGTELESAGACLCAEDCSILELEELVGGEDNLESPLPRQFQEERHIHTVREFVVVLVAVGVVELLCFGLARGAVEALIHQHYSSCALLPIGVPFVFSGPVLVMTTQKGKQKTTWIHVSDKARLQAVHENTKYCTGGPPQIHSGRRDNSFIARGTLFSPFFDPKIMEMVFCLSLQQHA